MFDTRWRDSGRRANVRLKPPVVSAPVEVPAKMTPRPAPAQAYERPEILPPEEKSITLGQTYRDSDRGRPIWSRWSGDRANKAMKQVLWVFACITAITDAASTVPFKLQRKEKGQWIDTDDSPIVDLLEMPNEKWDRGEYVTRMLQSLLLSGNALTTKIRDGDVGPVLELWLIAPDRLKPVVGDDVVVDEYEFCPRGGGKKKRIKASDVIHQMICDPENPLWGMSPLEPGSKTVDIEHESENWQKVSLQNGNVSDGVISYKRRLNREQWEEIRWRLRQQRLGSNNNRLPWVFGDDAVFTPTALTPQEADYMKLRHLTMKMIAALYRVPLPVLGDDSQSTYNNVAEAWKWFWRNTVLGWLRRIGLTLMRGLGPDFGLDPREYRLEPDTSQIQVLQVADPESVESATMMVQNGVPWVVAAQATGLNLPRFPGDNVSRYNGIPADVDLVDDFGASKDGFVPNASKDQPPEHRSLKTVDRAQKVMLRLLASNAE